MQIKLRRKSTQRMLQSAGIINRSDRLRQHPRTGRNTIFSCAISADEELIAKIDGLDQRRSGEIYAYRKLAGSALILPPVYVNDAAHLCVFKGRSGDQAAEILARENPADCLIAIMALALKTLSLGATRCDELDIVTDYLVDWPYPKLSQIIDCGPGFASALKMIQDMGLHHAVPCQGIYPAVFSHGDVKLNNILVRDGTAHLIDFELCCRSYPMRDIGALAGCILQIPIEHRRALADGSVSGLAFTDALACVDALMRLAVAHCDTHFPDCALGERHFYGSIVHFLLIRTLSEILQRGEMVDADRLTIDLAQHLCLKAGLVLC